MTRRISATSAHQHLTSLLRREKRDRSLASKAEEAGLAALRKAGKSIKGPERTMRSRGIQHKNKKLSS